LRRWKLRRLGAWRCQSDGQNYWTGEFAVRVKRLEELRAEQKRAFDTQLNAGFGELRAAFQVVIKRFDGIDGRFDGLESELRYRFEQLDRIDHRLENLDTFLRSKLNGGGADA
jgi:hypothetical protein